MTERQWKFTLKDGAILLGILAVAVLFVQKWAVARQLDIPQTEFEIVVRGEQQYPFILNFVKEGDRVFQKGSPNPIGVVSQVRAEPSLMESWNQLTGRVTKEPLPDRYDVYLTLKSRGFASLKGNAVIDNNMIHLNQYLVINTGRIWMPVRVISIADKG